jgi:hypothetical protein
MPSEEPKPRPRPFTNLLTKVYLFEWISLLSLAAIAIFAAAAPVSTEYTLLARLTLRRMTLVALASIAAILVIKAVGAIRSPLGWRRSLASSELATRRFWTDFLRIMAAFSISQTAHMTFKVYIPVINPGNYDALFYRLDQALFAGHDPVALVLGLFTNPTLLRAFDALYSGLYFFLLWGGVVVSFAFLERDRRTTFFSSFVMMWQLGLLLYILLPSWGPVFTHPDLFEETLQHFPLTVMVQSGLYKETAAIVQGQYNIVIHFFGLAAFPSLHVAVFVLYGLWGRLIHRAWFYWNALVGVLIFIGSMLTGYHYLVDGLGGALIAAFGYVAARRYALLTSPARQGSTIQDPGSKIQDSGSRGES